MEENGRTLVDAADEVNEIAGFLEDDIRRVSVGANEEYRSMFGGLRDEALERTVRKLKECAKILEELHYVGLAVSEKYERENPMLKMRESPKRKGGAA